MSRFNNKPNYTWHTRQDGSIFISDLCNLHGGMSVTNAAEQVLTEIHAQIDLAGRVVVYEDTEGNVDQLVHEAGVFRHFAFGDPCKEPE